MANFFDKFPLIGHTVKIDDLTEMNTIRNLLFRVGIIKEVMDTNIDSYYLYFVKDSDRPETLADKIYGDPEAHWVILYANNIYDPYYDWPMDSNTFDKYIINKYGSVEWAQTNFHHYEKVITRESPIDQITETKRFVVNEKVLTEGVLTVTGATTNYQLNEIAFIGNNNATNTFSGRVMSWTSSNGRIVLANTTGTVTLYTFLNGATSTANGTVSLINEPLVSMDAYNTLTDTTAFSTYTVAGKTVFETISRNRVSYYDYELQLNEEKRTIRIIQPRYYQQIVDELDNLTNQRIFDRRP